VRVVRSCCVHLLLNRISCACTCVCVLTRSAFLSCPVLPAGLSRTGPLGFTEVWEEGPAARELAGRQAALARAREDVEAARKVCVCVFVCVFVCKAAGERRRWRLASSNPAAVALCGQHSTAQLLAQS
jgi:hypothetical protein